MKTLIQLISLCIISIILSSCVSVKVPTDNTTIDQKVVLVKSAARTGTYFAIKEVYKDPAERIAKATFIKEYIIIFTSTEPITIQTIGDIITQHFSGDCELLIKDAVDILNNYISIDTSQVLTGDNKLLIKAFLNGVTEGCDMIIKNN